MPANDIHLATRYVGGLLGQTRRKKMERMDECVGRNQKPGQDGYQATRQLISGCPPGAGTPSVHASTSSPMQQRPEKTSLHTEGVDEVSRRLMAEKNSPPASL